ncbi:MAG: ABC transporter ATP-binding protein [Gammaproteobacteria bacterium]|nr:MAG: ABC transporter ATP-binding protein [Gammaproteobacteria bacterium]
MTPVLSIQGLSKTYGDGTVALDAVDLAVERGEIFALLGPNGAGKSTLINIVCGLVRPSGGTVEVQGHDIARDWRRARRHLGLVPQELVGEAFETVWGSLVYSRGLYGKAPDPGHLERLLRDLALWDKRRTPVFALSGGMKRRVMIAKALAHQPTVLFLDEPTAGVDVALRRSTWTLVERLRDQGVTVILTTHYLAEAEALADRIGIIDHGRLLLVERTADLMAKLGRKELIVQLERPLAALPEALAELPVGLTDDGHALVYRYDVAHEHGLIAEFLRRLDRAGIVFTDLKTRQRSLEDIFVELVEGAR